MFHDAGGTRILTCLLDRGYRQAPTPTPTWPHQGSPCIVALRPYQLVGLTMPQFLCVEADLLQCILNTTLAANSPEADVEHFKDRGFTHAMHSFCRAFHAHAEAVTVAQKQTAEDTSFLLVPDLTVYLKVMGENATCILVVS